jgi:hypothetical protein
MCAHQRANTKGVISRRLAADPTSLEIFVGVMLTGKNKEPKSGVNMTPKVDSATSKLTHPARW